MSLIISNNILTRYIDDGSRNITIPSTVTKIESNAFNGCQSLKSVTISSSVTQICSGAFKNCSSLESVRYSGPAILTFQAFVNCPKVRI